jgi:hypothetical protein
VAGELKRLMSDRKPLPQASNGTLGTHFLVYAKLTDKAGGNDFVHTNHAWDVEVLGMPGTYKMKHH